MFRNNIEIHINSIGLMGGAWSLKRNKLCIRSSVATKRQRTPSFIFSVKSSTANIFWKIARFYLNKHYVFVSIQIYRLINILMFVENCYPLQCMVHPLLYILKWHLSKIVRQNKISNSMKKSDTICWFVKTHY